MKFHLWLWKVFGTLNLHTFTILFSIIWLKRSAKWFKLSGKPNFKEYNTLLCKNGLGRYW